MARKCSDTSATKNKQLQFRPAAPDELQIDLDRPRARIPKRLLRLVSEHVQIKSVKYSKSKSGNTHATLRVFRPRYNIPYETLLQLIPNFERILLQLALGSDPVRELLSWGRARNGCPYPTLFFEEKK